MKTPHSTWSLLVASMIANTQGGTVTATTDSGAGSLRDVLAAAISGDVIGFAPALNGATITLTSGSLTIDGREITLDASALAAGVIVSGNHSSRILNVTGSATVTLRNLQFRNGRESSDNGGALYVMTSHLVMEACTIQDSFCANNGGGLYGNGMTASLTRCKITGNQAGNFGGGIYLTGNSPVSLASSQISGNKALFGGGGIYALAASPAISNCSVQGNAGGGLQNDTSANPVLRNCILWGNFATGGTTASRQLRNAGDPFFPDLYPRPDVAYCLIEGASGSASFNDGNLVVWGGGNLNGTLAANDPDFVGAVAAASAPTSTADLRVFTSSPVINAGNNAACTTSVDLAGNTRIRDGAVDLGAYESGYVSFAYLYPALDPVGDANGNGLSNALEYALGLDPAGPGDASALPTVSTSGGSLYLTSTRRANGIDIVPLWMTSTNLAAASWTAMVENVHYVPVSTAELANGRQQVVIRLLTTGPQRFYRQGFTVGN